MSQAEHLRIWRNILNHFGIGVLRKTDPRYAQVRAIYDAHKNGEKITLPKLGSAIIHKKTKK